jgi:hypothetical protein
MRPIEPRSSPERIRAFGRRGELALLGVVEERALCSAGLSHGLFYLV